MKRDIQNFILPNALKKNIRKIMRSPFIRIFHQYSIKNATVIKIISAFIFNLVFFWSGAQGINPGKLGLNAYTLKDENLGEVNFYVSKNKIEEKKPLLIYLDGSGAYPLFQYTEKGIGSSVVIDFKNLSNDYHVVLISKPGVPFIDSVKISTAMGVPVYEAPPVYKQKLSLEWRVNATKLVLDKLVKELKIDDRKIAVMGISEGFQVGAKLASIDKRITHAMLFVGNGLNQFFDFIIQVRTDAQTGKISQEEAQRSIESLNQAFKDIYANPQSTDKEWQGHTYLRWSSFTNNNPTENIASLKIPVYIVAAANDRNTAVLGTDYLLLEAARQKKNNISYRVYPYDHSFNEQVKKESGQIVSMKNHLKEVIAEGLNWLNTN